MKSIILILFFLFFSPVLWSDIDHESARKLVEKGEIVSLSVVLDKLQQISSGRILEVELEYEDEHQGLVYEIEILNQQGRILEYVFDARTGVHIDTEEED